MNISDAKISSIISPEEAHVATSPPGKLYLQRDGYLTASELFSARDLRSLAMEIDQIPQDLLQPQVLRELGEPKELRQSQFDTMQINWLHQLIPDFSERGTCSTARSIADYLLEKETHLTFASYIVKGPNRAGWTPW